jgi:hypothetical protein
VEGRGRNGGRGYFGGLFNVSAAAPYSNEWYNDNQMMNSNDLEQSSNDIIKVLYQYLPAKTGKKQNHFSHNNQALPEHL